MQAQIHEVFNTYNVNILFTVAALPARVSLGLPLGGPQLLQMAPPSGGMVQHQHLPPPPNAGSQARGAIPAGQAAPRTAPQVNKKFEEEDNHDVSGEELSANTKLIPPSKPDNKKLN